MNKLINIIYVQRKSFPNKVFFLKRNQTNNFHSLEYLPLSSSDTSLLLFENRNKS